MGASLRAGLTGLVLPLALCATMARADTVTYQQGDGKGTVSDTHDTTLNAGTPGGHYDTDTLCVVDQDVHQHCVVKFPNIFGGGSDQIPPGAVILDASLRMYVADAGEGGTKCPTLYDLAENWTESEATWDDRRTATAWSVGGAESAPSRAATPGLLVPCGSVQFETLDVTASVQGWSDGTPNEGWVFINAADNNGIDFRASDYNTDPDQRPLLSVEFVPSVFYSIGKEAGDMKTGSPKMTIATGVATLDLAQANDVGVGDVIDYDTDNKRIHIWEVVSSTEFRVQTATGTLPPDVTNLDVNSIERAFNSIGGAVTGSVNANHLNNGDLTAVQRRLTWVCYHDDGQAFDESVDITGYTTDDTYYITVTVAGASQVATGNSQRHTGTAGTGAVVRPPDGTAGGFVVREQYTRIEWLEIDGSDELTGAADGVDLEAGGENSLLQNLLIHDFTASNDDGIFVNATGATIRNSIVYDNEGGILLFANGATIQNTTVHNGAVRGVMAANSSSGHVVENVISTGAPTDFAEILGGTFASVDYSISSDASANVTTGTGNVTGQAAASLFMSLVDPVDLHLRAGAAAVEAGNDLSPAFTNDIDDQARPLGAGWDIGADETIRTVTPRYRSIGDEPILSSEGTITVTVGSPLVTKSGGDGWLTRNRGRGDVLIVGPGSDEYMIEAVLSEDELRIASLPATGYSGTTYSIDRQHDTLTDWYDCIARKVFPCAHFPVASSSLVADDRREVGIVYKDNPQQLSATWDLRDATTDAEHDIVLTADGNNRHHGVPGVGARIDNNGNDIRPADSYTTIEWLEFYGGSTRALHLPDALASPSRLVIRYNLLHDHGGEAIRTFGAFDRLEIHHNSIWSSGQGIDLDATPLPGETLILANTVYANTAGGIVSGNDPNTGVVLANNVSIGNGLFDYDVPNLDPSSSHNLSGAVSGPYSGTTHSPAGGGKDGLRARDDPSSCPSPPCVGFEKLSAPADLHLIVTSYTNQAVDAGVDLSAFIPAFDIDGEQRSGTWDAGSDELGGTTPVQLLSFTAEGLDGAVDLAWETGSELDNLGFHLHRSGSSAGPWTRLTDVLVPGLGFSPLGATYSWLDEGVDNGVRYHYLLEDVDSASISTFHGPVSAEPAEAEGAGGEEGEGEGEDGPGEGGGEGSGEAGAGGAGVIPGEEGGAASGSTIPPSCSESGLDEPCRATYGEPAAPSVRVVSRSGDHAVVELRTPGFVGDRDESGRFRISIPGFDRRTEPRSPDLPLRRVLLDAVVGRTARVSGVEASDEVRFEGMVPAAVGFPEMDVRSDGTVRPTRRPATLDLSAGGLIPSRLVASRGVAFQGEAKTFGLDLSPLRYDPARQELVLARTLRVRVDFLGADPAEAGAGRFGRRVPRRRPGLERPLAILHTSSKGLHRVAFEEVFRRGARPFPVAALGLERQGETVCFHVEPVSATFGPGSVLYFYVGQMARSDAFSDEVAFTLVRSARGVPMPVTPVAPHGEEVTDPSLGTGAWEVDRIYQPGLLEAPDLWLWDAVAGGASRTQPFVIAGLDPSSPQEARVTVHLQGASDAAVELEHHLRVQLGPEGARTLIGETTFGGKLPHSVSFDVPVALLREGENELTLENLGDTGAHSLVFLDRFEVEYPQAGALGAGLFEGVFPSSGTATLSGVLEADVALGMAASGAVAPHMSSRAAISRAPSASTSRVSTSRAPGGAPGGPPLLGLDITAPAAPLWLTSFEPADDAVRLRVEAGRRYHLVTADSVLSPRVEIPHPSSLGSPRNQADYVLIAPEAFLSAAAPLLARREDQGLRTRAVSFETVATVFGQGQASAEAIRSFLTYAFHEWAPPSPRYVVLLGDSSTHARKGAPAPLPALWARTSYLWTVSDPTLAAVNGDDLLPDLAIGRLPAATVDEAEALVQKILDWESSGQALDGRALLVADNPDGGGDFEADVEDIATSFLSARATRTLLVGALGSHTKAEILGELDRGASLVSYVGHGGSAVWASENVLNSLDPPALLAQPRQPLMLTLNCLNGYFVTPALDSLAEAFLKVEGRGTIAAFTPSGLSTDAPAHQLHRAVMAEIASGRHSRLGDAILAAQESYARLGLMPELLSIYHLLGDPGLVLQ